VIEADCIPADRWLTARPAPPPAHPFTHDHESLAMSSCSGRNWMRVNWMASLETRAHIRNSYRNRNRSRRP